MEGYISKKGQLFKTWKVRWFVVEGKRVTYYKNQLKQERKGKFDLTSNSHVRVYPYEGQHTNVFMITIDDSRNMLLSAPSEEIRDKWIDAIQAAITVLLGDEITSNKSITNAVPVQDIASSVSNNNNGSNGRQSPMRTRHPPQVLKSTLENGSTFRDSVIGTKPTINNFVNNKSVMRNSSFTSINNEDDDNLDSPNQNNNTSPSKINQDSNHDILSLRGSMKNQLYVKEPSKTCNSNDILNENDNQLADGWIEAQTEDGRTYYYHSVTRLSRWDKPDKHVMQAVENRLKQAEEQSERLVAERMQNLEKERQIQHEKEETQDRINVSLGVTQLYESPGIYGVSGCDELYDSSGIYGVSGCDGDIERNLKNWKTNRYGGDHSFPDLLRELAVVLPSELLIEIYSSSNKAIFDSLANINNNSNPLE
eukprot:gene12637-16945_t